MKKLMFAAVAALAMVGAAQATKSYDIMADAMVKAYSLDSNPGAAHKSWYSGYAMKQEDAQKAMGTTETVTYSDMATWLGKNFADNKKFVIDNAEMITCLNYVSGAALQYSFNNGKEGESFDLEAAIGVFFYDDGANVAYNVMDNRPGGIFDFDDKGCAGSGWVAAPEPTSGLLLLLGIAGLALKRKCA